MENMSHLIVRIEIAARKAALTKNDKKKPLAQKAKLLFLLRGGVLSPSDIIEELNINKCNLALLSRELADEGLIIKQKKADDRREISMAITKKGADYLDDCLSKIESSCKSAFGSGYNEANEKLQNALNVLEFI